MFYCANVRMPIRISQPLLNPAESKLSSFFKGNQNYFWKMLAKSFIIIIILLNFVTHSAGDDDDDDLVVWGLSDGVQTADCDDIIRTF